MTVFLPRILRVDEILGDLSVPSWKERERITDKGRWRERILMYTFHLESSLRRDIFILGLGDEISYSRYREWESITKVHPAKLLTRKSTCVSKMATVASLRAFVHTTYVVRLTDGRKTFPNLQRWFASRRATLSDAATRYSPALIVRHVNDKILPVVGQRLTSRDERRLGDAIRD